MLTGKLPVGYTFQAKSKSSETHQIPVPDQIKSNECNTEELFHELLYFLSVSRATSNFVFISYIFTAYIISVASIVHR